MIQWLRTVATLPKKPDSIHSTHMAACTTCNSRYRGSDNLFWPPKAVGMPMAQIMDAWLKPSIHIKDF